MGLSHPHQPSVRLGLQIRASGSSLRYSILKYEVYFGAHSSEAKGRYPNSTTLRSVRADLPLCDKCALGRGRRVLLGSPEVGKALSLSLPLGSGIRSISYRVDNEPPSPSMSRPAGAHIPNRVVQACSILAQPAYLSPDFFANTLIGVRPKQAFRASEHASDPCL